MNLHRFDVKTITTTLNYKRDQITMNLHQFDIKTIKNVESRHKTFKTTQNYKTDQITMICIDLMSKRSKNPKLQKQSNNDQFASIWHQNEQKCWDTSQNYKSDHIMMNLNRFDVKTITTTQNYESDQIIMYCINLTSKRSKKLSYVPKLQKWSNYKNCIDLMFKRSKNAKLQKQSNNDQFASIWRQNEQKCWVTSQNIQNNAKLRKWSNYNELHRFDVKTFKTFELGRKTTKVIKLQWSASIWHQNNQKCWVTS